MPEIKIALNHPGEAQTLCGKHDRNLSKIEKACSVTAVLRNGELIVSGEGEGPRRAKAIVETLLQALRSNGELSDSDIDYALRTADNRDAVSLQDLHEDRIQVASKQRYIMPKTEGQQRYIQALRSNDMVFGIGPAGTGKTYIAMAMAVEALIKGDVSRIILTRPAVEAGERLGYLPGDLADKISPYLRPLYDALHEMMDDTMIKRYIERDIIQVAPLAYMRGRTLNDSYVVLDEAQNTTMEQMKMFLTRMGFDSKCVITGDITQIDLPQDRVSGLLQAKRILEHIEGIAFVALTAQDVVRHRLVQSIIEAYNAENAA